MFLNFLRSAETLTVTAIGKLERAVQIVRLTDRLATICALLLCAHQLAAATTDKIRSNYDA